LAAGNILLNGALAFSYTWRVCSRYGFDISSVFTTTFLSHICVVEDGIHKLGNIVSTGAEVHIAVCTLASMYRCTRILSGQHLFFHVLWPMAVMLAGLESYLVPAFWRKQHGCLSSPDPILPYWMGSIMTICVVCYILAGIGTYRLCRSSPGIAGFAVRRRIWFRTKLYISATLISYGPYTIAPYLVRHPFQQLSDDWASLYYITVDGLLGLSGFFNCIVYVLASRYGSRLQESHHHRPSPTDTQHLSFDVRFDPIARVREYSASIHSDAIPADVGIKALADALAKYDEDQLNSLPADVFPCPVRRRESPETPEVADILQVVIDDEPQA
jgi:hypothetical protein